MYPHERSLVAKMKNEPFALIGINSDRNKTQLKQRMKAENITWRSFWNGPQGTSGPISKAWGVRGWPTIYVLDDKGIIRYKNVRGSAMDKAVEALVAKVEGGSPGSTPSAKLREFTDSTAQDTAKPALRTWKDSTGQFSIQATFVRITGYNVVLLGIDKKEISLPLAKLSATDQQYVKARLTPPVPPVIELPSITNTIAMKLNLIPAGTFMMGTPETEKNRRDNEHQHKVTITKPFYMQTTEVTHGQWKAVMGTEPWKGKRFVKEGPNYPAVYVSWDDAVAYCKRLSAKEGKTYRLPTEAEWEYACRAGTQTKWSFGNDEKALGHYAWYHENTGDTGERYAHQVGLKKPNAFGLYDMYGNVHESCSDYYGEDYYKQSPKNDPLGSLGSTSGWRVTRGGTWDSPTIIIRTAFRSSDTPFSRWHNKGFRVVRELD